MILKSNLLMCRRWWAGSCLVVPFFLTACQRESVRVYRAPKDKPEPAAVAHAGAETVPEHLHWELPQGWEERSATGVRSANFVINGPNGQHAEVAVMPFKRMGGNDLDFVNLWRTSLGLKPVEASQVADMVQPVAIGSDEGKLFDVMDKSTETGEPPTTRMIVAMVMRGQTSWFFKLGGDAALVESERDSFKNFLKTVSFEPGPGEGSAGSEIGLAQTAPPPAGQGRPGHPQWEVPAGWTELAPTTMILAKFQLTGSDPAAQAEVTVSAFPGDVGGLLANVNRWRGQLGLPPLAEANLPQAVTPLDVADGKAMLVDVSGTETKTGQPARLVGAIIPHGGKTWFFKLLGNVTVAAEQKDAFLKFVQSAKLPNA
jgi:hypothetical protein